MKAYFKGSASLLAVASVVAFGQGSSALAQTFDQTRWVPRAEIGGYVGDDDLRRGEVGLFFPIFQDSDSLLFADIRGRFFEDDVREGNAAIGYRQRVGKQVLGIWLGYDGRTSALGNYFDQVSAGIEVLNPDWEVRLNGYWPLTDSRTISRRTLAVGGGGGGAPTLNLINNQLFLTTGGFSTTTTRRELALRGVDAEFGFRVPLSGGGNGAQKVDLRLFGAAYHFDHDDFAGDISGGRVRAELRVNDVFNSIPGSFAAIEASYQYDDVRDGQFGIGVRFNVPLGRPRTTVQPDQYDPLMAGFITRDTNVITREVTERKVTQGTREAVNDLLTGVALDRTLFVNPGDDLQMIIDDAGENTHLVLRGGGDPYDGTYTLPDNFTLQGAGSTLTVVGRQSGIEAEFSPVGTTPTLVTTNTQTGNGAATLTIGTNTHILNTQIGDTPIVQDGEAAEFNGGTGIAGIASERAVTNVFITDTLVRDITGTGIHLEVDDSTITLNNVAVTDTQGAGIALMGDDGDDTAVRVADVSIMDTGGVGLLLEDLGGTLTFTNIDIAGAGLESLMVNGGSARLTFNAASSIIHGSDAAAIRYGGGTANTGLLTFAGILTDTAGLGLVFSNADGTYDFGEQVTLSGGNAGIDILGGSAGTFTFTNTVITNPSGPGIELAGSRATVNFGPGSSITQGNNAAALRVNNDASTLNFGGTLDATNGNGLRFNNADGRYNFAGQVTLNGGTAGIDILGDSAGTFTFTNTDITNPNGPALDIAGSTATVNFGPGSSITQGNNADAVRVTNDASMLNFDGTLGATNGDGLQFDNAGGEYDFTGGVTLAGGNAGIDIIGSTGTFTFTDIEITDPAGTALEIANSTATVGFGAGSSITQGNNADAVTVTNDASTVTIDGTIDATNGDGLQFDNADGIYNFTGPVTLAGGNSGIDIIGSTGTFTFTNTDITDPSGTALEFANSTATVGFGAGSSITQGNNADAVTVTNDASTVTIDGTIDATNGDGLQFDNADGIYDFAGQVTLSGGNTGIDILNDSAGTFTFSNTDITDPTGEGLAIADSTATVNFGAGSSITQGNNADAVTVSNDASTVTIDGMIDATNGDGLQFDTANGIYNFTGPVTLAGGNAGIDIIGSTGTFTFTNTDITDPAGTALEIANSTATIGFGPGSSITQGNNASAVNVANDASMLTFDGTLIATNGDGLQFTNADGSYDFTGTTTLNGLDTGIDILGGSAGTFTFANTTSIQTTTGPAVQIVDFGTGGQFDYNGSIATNDTIANIDTTAAGSQINFNRDGGNTLTSTNSPISGIFIFDADGDITFDIPTTITNASFSALFAGLGSGTYTFNDLTIRDQSGGNGGVDLINDASTVNFHNLDIETDFSGTGFGGVGLLAQPGSILNVTGDSRIQSIGGPALVLQGTTAFDLTFSEIISRDSTQIGPSSQNGILILGAGTGTLTVTDGVTIDNTGSDGIVIDDVDGTLTFVGVDITNTGRDGISVGDVIGAPAEVTIVGSRFDTIGDDALSVGATGLGTGGNLSVFNTTFTNITGFTLDYEDSIIDGNGNVAPVVTCNDDGGNTGTMFFNGGADTCP